jgi:hypothetical protein
MPSLSGVLNLQARSRRNALGASAVLRRRRADGDEAQRVSSAAARHSFLDGAYRESTRRSVSPELPRER